MITIMSLPIHFQIFKYLSYEPNIFGHQMQIHLKKTSCNYAAYLSNLF